MNTAGLCFIEPADAVEAMESVMYCEIEPPLDYSDVTIEEAEAVVEEYIEFFTCPN
jgi:hypothetical protein